MMPKYGTDTVRTYHGYGKDTDLNINEVSDMLRHDTLPILKHPCIIGNLIGSHIYIKKGAYYSLTL